MDGRSSREYVGPGVTSIGPCGRLPMGCLDMSDVAVRSIMESLAVLRTSTRLADDHQGSQRLKGTLEK
jgi:hypothetical protein